MSSSRDCLRRLFSSQSSLLRSLSSQNSLSRVKLYSNRFVIALIITTIHQPNHTQHFKLRYNWPKAPGYLFLFYIFQVIQLTKWNIIFKAKQSRFYCRLSFLNPHLTSLWVYGWNWRGQWGVGGQIIYIKHISIVQYKKKGMRKRVNHLDRATKENRYDQVTNLGIDLESSFNRSIVLPKIYNKIAEIEATEYVRHKRAKEDREMSELKGEIMKLRRHICLLQDTKMIQRLKTEDYEQPPIDIMHRPKQSYHLGSANDLRNSIQANCNPRYQRNTDKYSLRRQQNSSSFLMDNSQIHFTNSIIKSQNKNLKEMSKEKSPTHNAVSRPKEEVKQTPKEEAKNNGSSTKIKNKPKGKPNPRLKRKFRVMVYVVYFTLFISAFSKRNYQNKLKLIMAQYPHEVAKYSRLKQKMVTTNAKTQKPLDTNKTESKYKIDEAKLWLFFQERINIIEMVEKGKLSTCLTKGTSVKLIKQHFQFLINNQLNSSDKDLKEEVTYEEQLMFPRNIEYLLNGFQGIIVKIIDIFSSFITKADFFQHRWKTFALGIMNNSFVHNSFPKLPAKVIESGIVRLHPFKEVLLVYDKETESMLLAYDILCRVLIFKWMTKLEKIKSKSESPQPNQLIASLMMTLFYLVCEKMLDDHLLSFRKSNEPSISVSIRNKFIRPIVPLLVSSSKRRDEKLFKTSQIIANAPFQEQCVDILANNPAFVLTIQAKVKNIGFLLYEKLKAKMKDELITIKKQTLNERFFSVSKRVKRSNGQIEIIGQEEEV